MMTSRLITSMTLLASTRPLSRSPRRLSFRVFWDAGLSKIPANVYFRDHAPAAIEIAKLLEAKAGDNGAQLLSLTTFYLTIEDGADAKRIAEKVIAAEPASAPAYRMLGLADRMVFRLDDSASAFAKALEIEPASVEAKQGLAEMKRALGHADEAPRSL